MQAVNKIYVIGIGYRPLDKRAREIITDSQVILASNRLFEIFKGYEEFEAVKEKIKVINNVDETIDFIRVSLLKSSAPSAFSLQPIVLLASGDPMFFGIGRRAVREFGKDNVEILPDLSSIQMAFSKIKEPWDDAFLISLHGGPDPEKRRRLPYEIGDIPFLLQKHNKIAILTDKENNPAVIADVINSEITSHREGESTSLARNESIKIYVCERLGYADEKVTEGTPDKIAEMTFSEPNVVIAVRTVEQQNNRATQHHKETTALLHYCTTTPFGLTENEIAHSKGLITKDEVRAVIIHKLRLPQKGIFWDIGAGSGSVSLEASRLYPELKVFAIEKNEDQINHIKENILRFNTPNIQLVKGEAPDALKSLPSPDRVFIGGSGGRLKEIMNVIAMTSVKIAVINATTIETLNEALQYFENHGFDANIFEISVSRSKMIANKRHMRALNPIFIITGEK